jgi:DNA transposition AAA+ family ATPase
MAVQHALKKDSETHLNAKSQIELPAEYNHSLHACFLRWKRYTRYSVKRIARRLKRSESAVTGYMNGHFTGDIAEFEKQIATVLLFEEDLRLAGGTEPFCDTRAAKAVWEVCQFAFEEGCMGLAVGPSGSGKSETAKAYQERYWEHVILITASIVTRRVGTIIRLISGDYMSGATSVSLILEMLADKFKHSKKLIIIDDAHFLTWECFEAVRNLHDLSGVGVALLGQEKLYDQMRGKTNHGYLYDQLFSRIAIKRDRLPIERQDVRMIADGIFPGLDKECVDFLFSKAQGKGRFRAATNILRLALKRHKQFGDPIDIDLLTEASRFLMI